MEAHIELIGRIMAGDMDDHLPAISNALRSRQDVLTKENKATLTAGCWVTLANRISPKYLAGARAEVIKVMKTNVRIKLLEIPGKPHPSLGDRFKVGDVISCPVALIEFEDPNEAARKIVASYA